MRKGNVDFTIPAIKKFRRFVELNCFKRHDLQFFEQVDERKTKCSLIVKLYIMKRVLTQMFPVFGNLENIGLKYYDINKNIYSNVFYHSIYDKAKSQWT